MALHELATNAAKYGALSNDRGQIYVDWSAADAAGQFRLTWREIGGSATLEFRSDGVVCTLECPLR